MDAMRRLHFPGHHWQCCFACCSLEPIHHNGLCSTTNAFIQHTFQTAKRMFTIFMEFVQLYGTRPAYVSDCKTYVQNIHGTCPANVSDCKTYVQNIHGTCPAYASVRTTYVHNIYGTCPAYVSDCKTYVQNVHNILLGA